MKNILKNYLQIPFLLSLILPVVFAGGVKYYNFHYGYNILKKPLPLKAPFEMLDEKLLGHYKVLKKAKIDNKDIIESLGTEEYLQWTLEDTTADSVSPVKDCSLFITYYTGSTDQVPHVPEACYIGGGFDVEDKFTVDLNVGDINVPGIGKDGKVSATGLIFSRKSDELWQVSARFPVIYFFKVNGQYKGNRTTTRIALGDLMNEYSYFSKIEIGFSNLKGLYPEKAQAIEATERLLKVLLPVLEKNHWPDWK
ncbi:MAG: hypothetical protein ABSE89_03790 [Sedimentisphaerales bacterium]